MRQVLTTTALIVSFAFLPSNAHAEQNAPPKGFRNYDWGVAASRDLINVADAPDGVTMFIPAGSKKPDPLFDVPVAEEAFYFSNGRFYQGDAWLDGKGNFNRMIVALTKRYGPPFVAMPSISQWKWKWSNSPTLAGYPEEAKPVIARCYNQMREYGWTMIKACADQDIEAENALGGY